MNTLITTLENLLDDYYRTYFLVVGFLLGSEIWFFVTIISLYWKG